MGYRYCMTLPHPQPTTKKKKKANSTLHPPKEKEKTLFSPINEN